MAKWQAENHRRICRIIDVNIKFIWCWYFKSVEFSHRRVTWQDTGTHCSQSQSAASTQQCQSLSLCHCSRWVYRLPKLRLQLWANGSLMPSESLPSRFLLLLLLCELLCLFWLHKHHTLSGQCVFHFPGRNRNTPRAVGTPILRLCAMFIFIMCFSIIHNLLLPKLLISGHPCAVNNFKSSLVYSATWLQPFCLDFVIYIMILKIYIIMLAYCVILMFRWNILIMATLWAWCVY